jgi:putative thioredoxin
MTQQPFSRPGAIDLSGLTRPAGQAPQHGPSSGGAGAGAPAGGPAGGIGGAAGASAYALDVDEQSFQSLLESSMSAPVVLVFYSTSQAPESAQMARDVATVAGEYDGRFLAGLVDIDATPAIAQAMQIPQVPMLFVLLDGRPATQPIPGLIRIDELRTLFNQLGQQLTAQGITGRHQPRSVAAPVGEGEEQEPIADPRYAAAQDALGEGDIDLAVAEYQKLVDANPADTEAAAGLAMAKVLQRTQGVDLTEARAAGAANPDDVDAQTLVADLDMLGGHVDDAFNRLIDLVRRTSDADRNKAREHLLGLFAAVGNADPRVTRARGNLASALF